MKAISSLELAGVVSELQEFVGAKINQIYQVQKRLYFELYKEKRVLLVVEAGKRLNLTQSKEEMPFNPPGFCTLLRKRVKGLKIAEIKQHEFDRVVVFKFWGRETYFLVAELFAKGNLILCDKDMKIVQPLKVEFWKSRSVKPKTPYVFPPPGANLLTMDKAGFKSFLASSKKNLVSTLVASGLGKPGEEVCDKLGIDRKSETGELSEAEIGKVWKEVSGLIKAAGKSKGLNQKIDKRFTEGIEEEQEEVEEEAEEKAQKKWDKRKGELERGVEELEEKVGAYKKSGEWIQGNNVEVQDILDGVRKDLKSGMGKAEVEKKYKVKLQGEKVVIATE